MTDDPDALKAFIGINARLAAIEVLLVETLATQYDQLGTSEEQANQLIEIQAEHLGRQAAFRTDDPALSDLANAELQEHVERLSERVKEALARVRSSRR